MSKEHDELVAGLILQECGADVPYWPKGFQLIKKLYLDQKADDRDWQMIAKELGITDCSRESILRAIRNLQSKVRELQ